MKIIRYPLNQGRLFDIHDLEELIQREIEDHVKSKNLEERLSLASIQQILTQETQSSLSELDERIVRRLWTRKILERWVDEAVSAFEKSIENGLDPKGSQEKLKQLQVTEFWDVQILKDQPLQKLMKHCKDLFDVPSLQACLEAYREGAYSHLKQQNNAIANELRFLQEFLRILREEADEKFFFQYRELVKSSRPDEQKFLELLEIVRVGSVESLKVIARILENEKNFYFPKEFFKTIQMFFQPTTSRIYVEDGITIYEVNGSAFSVSGLHLDKVNAKEIHLISQITIKLDEDICLPGVNVLIQAERLTIPTKVEINTSGKPSEKRFSTDAGQDSLKNGNDGSDGEAGESAGNVCVKVTHIDHLENLKIVADGGNGSDGQSGGSGLDGKDGNGMTQEDLKENLSPTAAYLLGLRSGRVQKVIDYIDRNLDKVLEAWWTGKDANTWNGVWQNIKNRNQTGLFGIGYITQYADECIFLKVTLKNGLVVTFAWECGGHLKWTNCQSYLLVEGTKATPGTDGGAPGTGGQGGFPGSIIINGKTENGTPGKNGANGIRGRSGADGKSGWDIGWLDYSVSGAFGADSWPKFQGTNKNSRLELKPFVETRNNRIVCPYRRSKNYSDFMMEMRGKQQEDLVERETNSNRQRQKNTQHQVMASRKSNIKTNSLQQEQSDIFATARQMLALLQQSHSKNSQTIDNGMELVQEQSEIKADMTVSRQVEFQRECKKKKFNSKLHSIKGTLPPSNQQQKLFLLKLLETAQKINLSDKTIENLCPKAQCIIKCDDRFLRRVEEDAWSRDFKDFVAIFKDEKKLDLKKSFDELQKRRAPELGRVVRHFVLDYSKSAQDSTWYGNLLKKILNRNETVEKAIAQLKEGYNVWLDKKATNLIVFEESLAKVDKRCEASKELMEKVKGLLQEKPCILSNSHVELVAQKKRLQVQFYEEDENQEMTLIETFNPLAKKILRVTVDRGNNLCQVKHNFSLFRLEKERLQKALIHEAILGLMLRFSTTTELNNFMQRNHYLQLKPIEPTSLKAFDQWLDVEKAISQMKVILQNETVLWKRLRFISEPFIGTNRLLHALRDRLCTEGCLISSEELGLFINTVLEMSQLSDYFIGLMLWIIIAREQKCWLVECAILAIENHFERPIPTTIGSQLYALTDKQIIFLLLKQLKITPPNQLTFETFENVINLLQKNTKISLLADLNLKQWPLVLKMDYWSLKLQNLTKWNRNEDLQRVLHYLSTVEVLYKEYFLKKLFDVFTTKKDQINAEIVLELFEALYSEKCFLTDPFLNLLTTQPVNKWLSTLDIDSQNIRSLTRLIEIINNNDKISQSTKEKLGKVEEVIKNSNALINKIPKTEAEVKKWANDYKKNCSLSEVLAVINRAIELKEKFSLRDTQKIAIVLFCLEEEMSRVLEQVSTGEGKSLIVASLAIIRALNGEKVDVITSSSVLARRDAEVNEKLYKMFNLNVGHNCSESLQERTDAYGRSNVIYGEITNFQRDHLLDRFYGKNILGNRKFDSVIVDEVDSMLLDKGNNVLYLSHQIAGFDKLESVFIYIWQLVNRPVKNQEDFDSALNTEHLRENVIDNMYRRITKEDLKLLETKDSRPNQQQLWNELIQNEVIDGKGRLLMKAKIEEKVNQLRSIETTFKVRLTFLLNEALQKQCMARVPNFLIEFVEEHLAKWIENAKTALFMIVSNDYVVDIDRTGVKNDLHANITILDRDTGTDQASSQWEEGLHQFLQIKHGCKMSPMSLKAIFISNVSYFKLYKSLFGLTGTLGSVTEMDLLQKIHNVEYVTIPTACGKKFFEETPAVCENEIKWMERIHKEVLEYSHQRSVLVICETVESVNFVQKKLTAQGIKNIFAYRREHEDFTVADTPLLPAQVIVATNLAGRGTDIKVSDALRKAGGLHICLTYLPSNKRVEGQAFGRAARSGDPGSGRLVIVGEDNYGNGSVFQMIQIKSNRDSQEIRRIADIKANYEDRILAEEHCFQKFQDLYKSFGSNFTEKSVDKVNLLENQIDQWAFWLDKWKPIINNNGNKHRYEEELLQFVAKAEIYPVQRSFILMPHLIRLAKTYVEQKHYDDAVSALKTVIAQEPHFSEVAHYYKAYAIGKSLNWKSDRSRSGEVVQELKIAKRMFEKLCDFQLQYSAIVGKMKENFESSGVIQINSYEEQKQTMITMYQQLISSIDEATGSAVSQSSFNTGVVDEDTSAKLFELFSKEKILVPMKFVEKDTTESLEQVCLDYGIDLEQMKAFLKKGYQGDLHKMVELLRQNFPLPNRDDFWDELLASKWIAEAKTYLVVDKEKVFQEFPLVFTKEAFDADSIDLKKFKENLDKCIVKTPEKLNETAEEKRVFEREAFKKLLKNVSYEKLLEKQLVEEVEIAERTEAPNLLFQRFACLGLKDLSDQGIEQNEAEAVLQELVTSKVLGKVKQYYYLDANDLSKCSLDSGSLSLYTDTVRAVLQRKFAYRLALNRMKKEIESNSWPVGIPLCYKPHQGLFWDLVDAEGIKPVTVDGTNTAKAALDDAYPEYFTQNTLTEILKEDIPCLPYSRAWELLVERGHLTKATFNSTFTITEKLVHIYQNEQLNKRLQVCMRGQMLLRKETTKNEVLATLDCLKGLLVTLECPQPYLQSLYEALGSKAPGLVEELNIFMLNGLDEIIRFKEQAYTMKMIINTVIVVVMGLVQIAIGIAIQLFSAGLMTHVGAGFMSEGVSDLIFAISAMRSGYFSWSGYFQHKKESIMFTVVTCGIGAFLARGAQVSRYGAKLAEQGLKSSGKEVAGMCGKELIKEAGWSIVGKVVLKDFTLNAVKGVAFGASSQAVTALVDSQLRTLCNGLAESFYKQIKQTAANHQISNTFDKVYACLGPKRGKELIESHLKTALAERSFNETATESFLRYGVHVSRQIGGGLNSLSRQNASGYSSLMYMGGMVLKLGSYVTIIKNLYDLGTMIDQLLDNVNNSLLGCSEVLNAKDTYSNQQELEQFQKSTLNMMNDRMNSQIGGIIAKKFVEPVLQIGANHLVNFMGRQIKKQYNSYRDADHAQEFQRAKQEYQAKKQEAIDAGADQETQKAIDFQFQSTLNDAKRKIRDPKLYADIVREGGHMDMQCMKAYAAVLSDALKKNNDNKSYVINVEGQDGVSYSCTSGNGEKQTVSLKVTNEHFVAVDRNGQVVEIPNNGFDCMLEVLKDRIPELNLSNEDLREKIANRIETDLMIGDTIRHGLHALALRKGLYGGREKEKKTITEPEKAVKWKFSQKADKILKKEGTEFKSYREEKARAQLGEGMAEAIKQQQKVLDGYVENEELKKSVGKEDAVNTVKVAEFIKNTLHKEGTGGSQIILTEDMFKPTKWVEVKPDEKNGLKESVWVPVVWQAEKTITAKMSSGGTHTQDITLKFEINVDNPIQPDNGPPHPHVGYECSVVKGLSGWKPIKGHIILNDMTDLPGRTKRTDAMKSYDQIPVGVKVVEENWLGRQVQPKRKGGRTRGISQ